MNLSNWECATFRDLPGRFHRVMMGPLSFGDSESTLYRVADALPAPPCLWAFLPISSGMGRKGNDAKKLADDQRLGYPCLSLTPLFLL